MSIDLNQPYFDQAFAFNSMIERLQEKLPEIFGVQGRDRSLSLEEVKPVYPKGGLRDYRAQLKAKLQDGDYVLPIKGRFLVRDANGKVVEKTNPKTILKVPMPTGRGTFIVGGNEYAVKILKHQKPGVYTYSGDNGVRSVINTSTKQSPTLSFDPEKNKMVFSIGGRNFGLRSVMNILGVSDAELREAWGEDILSSNRELSNPDKLIDRLYDTMLKYDPEGRVSSREEKLARIRSAFAQSKLDPWTTNVTMGKEYRNVTPQLFLEASKKMLRINAGKDDEDVRDALHFQTFHGFDDSVLFGLEKEAGKIAGKIRSRLDDPNMSVDKVISVPIVHARSATRGQFTKSNTSSTPEQVNPLDMKANANEVSSLGEGAIGSVFSITDALRRLDDSTMGFLDPIHTPTTQKIGVSLHLAKNVKKKGDQLYKTFTVPHSGERVIESPTTIYDKYVALPGTMKLGQNGRFDAVKPKVRALHQGRVVTVAAKDVDLYMGGPNDIFDDNTSLVPFLGSNNPVRIATAVKQMGHSLPLVEKELPLVRAMGPAGKPEDEQFAENILTKVPSYIKNGTVTRVGKTSIVIKDDSGKDHKIQYYNDFPLNSETTMNETPVVKAGDKVKSGDVLASNDFVKDGALALGRNLHIAFYPKDGMNYMDGLVVSESAAAKMAAIRQYRTEHEKNRHDVFSKKKFLAHNPIMFPKEFTDTLDDDGIVKEGTIVTEGMPLMVNMKPRKLSEDALVRGQTSKVFNRPFINNVKTWDHSSEGVVKRVVNSPTGVKIYISTAEPLRRGDKISNRYYAKGVIGAVIPDDEMPRTKHGEIIDIIQNPAAVPSRMNTGQIMEAAAAKLAKKMGKPYFASTIDLEGNDPRKLYGQMKENNVSDQEVLYDKDGNPIASGNKIFTGYQYFSRQKQQAEKYYQARNAHDPYDVVSRRPIQGPKVGALGFYALLAHGAHENLKEISTIQSEQNDDYWNAVEAGTALPAPRTPFAFDKLQNFLKGAGINIRKEGEDYRLLPMTDEQVMKMSNGEVVDPGRMVDIGKPGKFDTLQATPDGLYDRKLFGGFDGNKWGHIDLGDYYPNPTFERAMRAVTDLKEKEVRGLVDGTYVLTGENKVLPRGEGVTGISGGQALKKMLGSIDVDRELQRLSELIPTAKDTNKSNLIKKARYLSGLKRTGLSPSEAYLMSKVPVLPAKFRPVYMGDDNSLRVSDFSLLYKDMGLIARQLKNAHGLPASVHGEMRSELYDAVNALQVGTTGRGTGPQEKAGILSYLKGPSPTVGHFQRNIFSKRRAIGGRAVIMPNPSLGIDEVGLPEDMAWHTMESFVIQKLTSTGMTPLAAKREFDDRTIRASGALDAVLRERPILLARDPKLHKFNTMAFWARRVPGKSIEIPPLICKGFNADFDGDAMSVSVPVGAKAVLEARTKMMPSQNLFKAGPDTVLMRPEEDAIAGIYAGTRIRRNTKQTFSNFDSVIQAYKAKELKLDDGVYVAGQLVSPGRILFNEGLPEEERDYNKAFDNDAIGETLNRIAKKDPRSYANVLTHMKDNGDNFGTTLGISFSLKDFFPLDTEEVRQYKANYTGGPIELPKDVQDRIKSRMKQTVDPNSALALLADSGAKGSWSKLQQVLYSPVTADQIGGGTVPYVITSGYAGGMDFEDYWNSMKGARQGMYASAVEVSDPGYFAKQMLRANAGFMITPGDKTPSEGIEYSVDHPTVMSRYLATDLRTKDGKLIAAAGDPIDSDVVNQAKAAGLKTLFVRSPLTSVAPNGIYARDFGRLPGGQKPSPGDDIGVISSHTITEPTVQGMLRAFHAGGGGGGGNKTQGLYAIWPLLNGIAPAGEKAAMSPYPGTVQSITKIESGASKITLDNGQTITTYAHSEPTVKVGERIKAGHQLQNGFLDPKELLKYRGLRPLQTYLVDQIEQNYGDNAPDRRYIETIVAGLTRYGRVLNPGANASLFSGDVMPINQLREINRGSEEDDGRVEYEPIFVGMDNLLSKVEPDWASKMMGADMIRQLQDSAAFGLTSASKSPRPILPYIHGSTFGDRAITEGLY